jgi:hypothetical protein
MNVSLAVRTKVALFLRVDRMLTSAVFQVVHSLEKPVLGLRRRLHLWHASSW